MRFISMSWVILGHGFSLTVHYLDNIADYAEYFLAHGEFQAIGNATFSVDTFFFLSGLLVAYLGFRELEKRGTINVPLMYLSRYLRLTPTLAFVMLIAVSIFGKFGAGPNWSKTVEAIKEPCEPYWWTNLLYISNLYTSQPGDECLSWTWYLANDMQFYLLSPVFLFALYMNPKIGAGLVAFFILGSVTATGTLSAVYDIMPDGIVNAELARTTAAIFGGESTAGLVNEPAIFSEHSTEHMVTTTPVPDGTDDFAWNDIYTKPWCRVGVYLIGMATGYFLHVTRNGIKMNKWFVLLMWIAVTATGLSIVYGFVGPITGGYNPTLNVSAFYNAVSRPVWAACMAWVIVACVNGYGGPINGLLTWKFFIPLSRLTYCSYLIHPLVYYYLFNNREQEVHFSIMNMVTYYLAALLLSLACAYIVSMCVEVPFGGISKVIFRRKRPKNLIDPVVIPNGVSNGDVITNGVNGDLEMKGEAPNGKAGQWNASMESDSDADAEEKGEKL